MSTEPHTTPATSAHDIGSASAGDWIEVAPPGGGIPKRGQILEVIGRGHHRRLRVRWEDGITIHYPSARERVVPRAEALRSRSRDTRSDQR